MTSCVSLMNILSGSGKKEGEELMLKDEKGRNISVAKIVLCGSCHHSIHANEEFWEGTPYLNRKGGDG